MERKGYKSSKFKQLTQHWWPKCTKDGEIMDILQLMQISKYQILKFIIDY